MLFLTGYPPEDLILKPAFIRAAREAAEALAVETADGGPALLLSVPWPGTNRPRNSVALLDGGEVQAVRHKVDLPNYGVFDEKRVFEEGPVPGPLMAVHTKISCSEEEIRPGIYFATQRENITQLVRENAQPFHVFSGYAGWGEGQLDGELEAGGWLTFPATHEYVFPPAGEEVWKKAVQQVGTEILKSSLKLDRIPDDPSVN